MRVCMLVKNSFEFDARVTREARTLTAAGHDVVVVALHVPGVTPRRERRPDGIEVIRVARIYGRLRDLLPASLRASTTAPGMTTPAPKAGHDQSQPSAAAALGSLADRVGQRRARAVTALPAVPQLRRAVQSSTRRALRALVRVAAWPLQRLNDVVVSRRMQMAAVATIPDVVHAHDLNTLAIGARVARGTHARLVYDAHELHTARNDATALQRGLARLRERRTITRADAVITATGTWADLMAAAYGIPRPAVLRNVPPHVRVDDPVDLRARLAIPAGHTVLLYQGSVQTNRGIEPTLAALPHIEDCTLVICGYGAHRPVLAERVRGEGLDEVVRFDGPVPNDELLAYTAGADIGLCLIVGASLSYRTSLPNKLFEYLMAGIPVIASDYPEMGAVVRASGAGEVCDPTDPAAIAAAVRRLREPDRYAAARHCARRAADEHHWDAEQQVLLDVYAGLSVSAGVNSPTPRSS